MTISTVRRTLVLACLLLAASFQCAFASGASPWSGCHAGVNIGTGWAVMKGKVVAGLVGSSNAFYFNPPADIGIAKAEGAAAGIQGGCDYQMHHWVLGVQGSFDTAHISGGFNFIGGTSAYDDDTATIKSLYSLTARGGYLFGPQTLVYLRAGAVGTRTRYVDADPSVSPGYVGTTNLNRSGSLVGIGVDHMFRPRLSVFLEFDHMDFGSKTFDMHYIPSSTGVWRYAYTQKMDYLDLGLDYHF